MKKWGVALASAEERFTPMRCKLLPFLAVAAAWGSVSGAAAQAYPTRPVHVIVGFAPGGTADVIARLTEDWLSQRLGQQFIVENRPGASTSIATEAVSKAAPDGYTLLLITDSNFINATLYKKLNYDFVRDIAPIASINSAPSVMVVNPSFPAHTVPEFISYANANPGKVAMASGGTGAPSHLAGEMFKLMTGVNMVHVPYRGAALALTDLLGGQVQVYFAPMEATAEYVRSGRLRALAVTTKNRLEALPDIPTVGESVPGFEVSVHNGIGAPRSTPPEIVNALNSEINGALADQKFKSRLATLGAEPMPMTPVEFGKFIVSETDKWAKVIQAANISPE
jgi:tripartite-type tricarboxylate transporter receptor subunit TctC